MDPCVRKTYQELIQSLNENNRTIPTYIELLETVEWYEYRRCVLERDHFTCLTCGTKADNLEENGSTWRKATEEDQQVSERTPLLPEDHPEFEEFVVNSKPALVTAVRVTLQAHHIVYVWDSLPWLYPDKLLQTLCDTCHTNVHLSHIIPLYKDFTLKEQLHKIDCLNCGGTGYLPEYYYYEQGLCFSCDGRGFYFE